MTTRALRLRAPAAPLLGLVLVLAAVPGLWLAPRVFYASWLAASWFDLGLVLGALSWLWIHRLTGGKWGDALRPHILRLADRLGRVLLLFLPLAFGLPLLYGWLNHPGIAATDAPFGRAFLLAWHDPAFFGLRCAVYASVWLVLARRARTPLRAGEAAASLVAHMAITSLASVDALVALVPAWSSSGFALAALASQAYGAGALITAFACRTLQRVPAQPATGEVPLSRDFGNLLMTVVLLWAYLAFMQLLIIWAENLPREISWFVPRLQTGWIFAGAALVALHFALPLIALLFRALKDSPRRLERLALAMLAANAFDAVWLVLPSVAPHSLASWWLAPCLTAGLALVSFGGGSWRPTATTVASAKAAHAGA